MHNRVFVTSNVTLASFSETICDKTVKIKNLTSPAFCLSGKGLIIAICITVSCELLWIHHDCFLPMKAEVE